MHIYVISIKPLLNKNYFIYPKTNPVKGRHFYPSIRLLEDNHLHLHHRNKLNL